MDKILVSGIEAYGFHGVYPEERTLGQTLVVDLEVSIDLRAAGVTDRLEDTISYVELDAIAREQVERTRYELIEAVAESIAKRVLELPGVEATTVRITKPRVPSPTLRGQVAVEIHRQKG